MSAPTTSARRFHPVDLLVLVLALALAALAYAFLFRRTPLPAAMDAFLGADIAVIYRVDRPWKRAFPTAPTSLQLGQLRVDLVKKEPVGDDESRLVLRVRGRDAQHPDAIVQFRGGLRRGARLRLWDDDGEVEVEVESIRLAESDGDSDD